jgi:hypothetical protein
MLRFLLLTLIIMLGQFIGPNAFAEEAGSKSESSKFISGPVAAPLEADAVDPLRLVYDLPLGVSNALFSPAPYDPAAKKRPRPNVNYLPQQRRFMLNEWGIKPVLEYSRLWDTNVFLSEGNRKEDEYHRVKTGFFADHRLGPKKEHSVNFAYGTTLEYFERFKEQTHDDHTLGIGGQFKVGTGNLSLSNTWVHQTSRGNINLPDLDNTRQDNTARALYHLPLARYFGEVEAVNFHNDNLSPNNSRFGRNELSITPRIGFNLTDWNQVYGEYMYRDITYPDSENRNGDAHQVGAGFRGFLDERTSFSLLTGYQQRVYETDERPDYHGLVFMSRVQRKFAEQRGLTLQFDRSVNETTYDEQNFVVQNGFSYQFRTPAFIDKFFIEQGGSVSYQEYSRISTVAGDSETRRDYVWNLSIMGEYFMMNDSVSLFAHYQFSETASNTFNLDIDGQKLTYGVKGYF